MPRQRNIANSVTTKIAPTGTGQASRPHCNQRLDDVESGFLPVRVGIQEREDPVAAEAHVEDQEIERNQRGGEGISEIAHAHPGNIKDAGDDAGAGNRRAQVGLEDDEA